MKKIIIVLLFFFSMFIVYADDISDALEESNKLLSAASIKIEQLENRIKQLEEELQASNSLIEKADKALIENNKTLKAANERIDKDQEEIVKLRNMIGELIDAGVEIATYHWNIMFTGGYPMNTGLIVAYNFHFFPSIGVVTGFTYNWDEYKPLMLFGIKINLK